MKKSIITYQFRVKDGSTRAWLDKRAGSINYLWNLVNDLTAKTWTEGSNFLSAFDISPQFKGKGRELGLHSQTVQGVIEEHYKKRQQAKRSKLRWRSRKKGTLGWIPFKRCAIKIAKDTITYNKKTFRFWKSRETEGEIKTGSFSQDARGRWYVNISCEILHNEQTESDKVVALDLGLKDLAVLSTGDIIENPKSYRKLESKLAKAQRANKKAQVRNIHAKIKNVRKDFLHKQSTKLVKNFKQIFVGNVSSSKLVKTKLAKSTLDAGWGMFKTMLENKAIRLGVGFRVVNEKYSTVTCSVCKSRTGPSGLSALGVRNWECSQCGSLHQRDQNSAINILNFALGHQSL